MLENIDLSRKVPKEEYKKAMDELRRRLAALQRRVTELNIPVIVVFEGLSAAGKGTLINELILPMDPRGFNVRSSGTPNEEESLRPFLWRHWTSTPARGRQVIYDRSWYMRVLDMRVKGEVSEDQWHRAYDEINAFERQLADEGTPLTEAYPAVHTGEMNVTIIDALANDRGGLFQVNVTDHGVPGIADDVAAEMPAYVSAAGIQPLKLGPLPEAVMFFMRRRVQRVQEQLDVYLSRSRNRLLLSVLASDQLGIDQAQAVVDDVLAHPGNEDMAAHFT